MLFDEIEEQGQHQLEVIFNFDNYDFLYFDEPVCYYSLKNIKSKVISFQQLQYYAEVFFYLNPDIDFKIFFGIFQIIGNREWGKSIRTYSKARVELMCQEVFQNKKTPYCSQWRRIIFNPDKIIRNDEKMSIAGELFSKHTKITSLDIEMAVIQLKISKTLISDKNISFILSCSQKTIQRNITTAIREDIRAVNNLIKRENKVAKIIEYIDILSEGGNEVKIRELRKFIAVKDYSLIKEAFSLYKDFL